MAAGLGFKDFTTGEVLTAADVDGYLMQGVWVFASAAARDAAVTSPQEGNFAYLKDTNVTTYYTGSAWANLDTTGMTNPMTTTGDTIYSSSGSTPARLGIGTTGQVLTVAGGLPSWATPTSGGMTLLSTTTLSGTSTTISSINQTYNQLFGLIVGPTWSSSADYFLMLPNNSSTIGNVVGVAGFGNNAYTTVENDKEIKFNPQAQQNNSNTASIYSFTINNYTSTTAYKSINHYSHYIDSGSSNCYSNMGGGLKTTSAITSLRFKTGNDYTFSAGTVLLYGVK
jgi:hypothetical protein